MCVERTIYFCIFIQCIIAKSLGSNFMVEGLTWIPCHAWHVHVQYLYRGIVKTYICKFIQKGFHQYGSKIHYKYTVWYFTRWRSLQDGVHLILPLSRNSAEKRLLVQKCTSWLCFCWLFKKRLDYSIQNVWFKYDCMYGS